LYTETLVTDAATFIATGTLNLKAEFIDKTFFEHSLQ
jgi:hypothetical protein